MKLEAFQKKVAKWQKNFPRAINKAIKKMVGDIKQEAQKGYSGGLINVRTGKTLKSITSDVNLQKLSARVYMTETRAFIGRLLEAGTRYISPRKVFEPLRSKYTPLTSMQILKELMNRYRAGG